LPFLSLFLSPHIWCDSSSQRLLASAAPLTLPPPAFWLLPRLSSIFSLFSLSSHRRVSPPGLHRWKPFFQILRLRPPVFSLWRFLATVSPPPLTLFFRLHPCPPSQDRRCIFTSPGYPNFPPLQTVTPPCPTYCRPQATSKRLPLLPLPFFLSLFAPLALFNITRLYSEAPHLEIPTLVYPQTTLCRSRSPPSPPFLYV